MLRINKRLSYDPEGKIDEIREAKHSQAEQIFQKE